MLRDYQTEALRSISTSWRSGQRSVLLVLPTGGGKTAIGAEAIRRTVSRSRSALFLAHRRELITQASQRLTAEGIAHGVVMAGVGATTAPVQIASVDTLRARKLRPHADLVIWDECHHVRAAGWSQIQADYPTAHHLGLTATPARADGQGLGDVFGSLVVGSTVAELTQSGYLVPCDIEAPASQLDSRTLAQDPVAAYQARCPGRKAVVYAHNVQEAHELAKRFVSAGVAAGAIDGTTRDDIRDATLQRFARGELRVICNVAVLTEGWDQPDTEVCIVARSVGHTGLWLQMIGRVLRPAPGKARALVLDLTGNVYAHGLPDEDREYALDGRGIAGKKSTPLSLCPMCGAFRRGWPCPRCQYVPETVRFSVSGEALTLVQGTLSKRDERLAVEELVRLAVTKQRKPGWVTYEFRQRYGYALSQQRYVAARGLYEELRIEAETARAETEREADPGRDSGSSGSQVGCDPVAQQHWRF